jgi:hypothetical protein
LCIEENKEEKKNRPPKRNDAPTKRNYQWASSKGAKNKYAFAGGTQVLENAMTAELPNAEI